MGTIPPATAFDRWRSLVAIEDIEERDVKPVLEVFTGARVATIPVGTEADVVAAVAKARAAQAGWAARPASERAAVLERYRGLVFANADVLMDVAQTETGKSRSAAQEELLDLALNARYYAKHGPAMLAPQGVSTSVPGVMSAEVRYQPKGVVGLIAPWNYPMAMSISDALPALLAGNAVVVKPDSQTPYCTLVNAELLYQAGVPREVFAVIPGPGSVVGSAIVDNCDYLMFTGSTATGRRLAEQCARRLIGISAELGGKNPMIVTRDANLDRAAKTATRACFANAGQLCMSIERIYVEEPVAAEFTEKFAAEVAGMKLGAAYDFSFDMGSLISADQLKTVTGHIEDAVAKGATVVAGGESRPDIGPLFHEPTLLTGVTDDMTCARTETFGPLVSIYPVADVDEAVARANDSEYGLNASVWAGSDREGQEIAARLRTGSVNVNEGYTTSYGATAAPMGGMGASGLGRRHGPDGLLKYCESQTIATQHVPVIDAPFGIPNALWQRLLTPTIRLVQRLPGR